MFKKTGPCVVQRQYRFTDRLLITLTIGNILMFISSVWADMFSIGLLIMAKYNEYTIPSAISTLLPSALLSNN